MLCPRCGYEMPDKAEICLACGYEVVPQTSSEPGPVGQLDTRRSLLKYVLLSILTLGLYGMAVMSAVSADLNIIAYRHDGRKTMHFMSLIFVFTPLTLGIGPFVWYHRLSNRIGTELHRRGIAYGFDAGTFWLWNVLGLLIIVGPLVYMHKLLTAMNLLAEDYNVNG